jgi:hypothetical protein
MGLTELPSELFCMKNLNTIWLNDNKLCSLPSDIALLTKLEWLYVRFRFWKRLDGHLTRKPRCFRSSTTSSRLFRPSSVC